MRKYGGGNVASLFGRAQNARTVMSGPSMAAVLGVGRPAAYAALGGFAGGFGGFGALVDLNGDVGRAQALMNKIIGDLTPAMTQARQVQANIASALSRPEGAQLQNTVQGIENSIEAEWRKMVGLLTQHGSRLERLEAITSTEPGTYSRGGYSISWAGAPSVAQFQAKGFTMADFAAANDVYLAKLQAAQATVNADQSYINASKGELFRLLNKYNTDVPAVAKTVQDAVKAEVVSNTTKINLDTAKKALDTAGTDTQVFVITQQLEQAKQAAAAAAKAAQDARDRASNQAKQIAEPSNSWKYLLGGAVVIGVGVYLLKRKK